MRTKEEIIEAIKKEYPFGIELMPMDYNDHLEPETIEKIIHSEEYDIYEEWNLWEYSDESVDYILKEIMTNEELENEELKEYAIEFIQNADTSDPLRDVLRNSSDLLYYDCNIELVEVNEPEDHKENSKMIRDVLNLKKISKENRKAIDEMIDNAYYGGTLTLLLKADNLGFIQDLNHNTIEVKDPVICIMDRCLGSGDYTTLSGITLQLPFTKENLHSDEGNNGYSIQEVFGTNREAGGDNWNLIDIENQEEAKVNEVEQERTRREKEYQATYDAGGCTFGDMKYDRHRNKEYINNFPCGTHCHDCGTFWID